MMLMMMMMNDDNNNNNNMMMMMIGLFMELHHIGVAIVAIVSYGSKMGLRGRFKRIARGRYC